MILRTVAVLACLLMGGAVHAAPPKLEKAVFAGGCFWCMDAAFKELPVEKVMSGYTGGHVVNPTYEQVSSGKTGHVEAIEVTFDPAKVSYATLLKHFWDNVDPTDPNGQFCDKGSQYGAGVFYTTAEQEKKARESLKPIQNKFSQPLAAFLFAKPNRFIRPKTIIRSYAAKNALRYKLYETGCGREKRLDALKK